MKTNRKGVATRVSNSWEYIDRRFARYNQFVTEAKALTEADHNKYNIINQEYDTGH